MFQSLPKYRSYSVHVKAGFSLTLWGMSMQGRCLFTTNGVSQAENCGPRAGGVRAAKGPSMFVVIVDDAVVYRGQSASQAHAFAEGYGDGEVAEVLAKAQENFRSETSSTEPRPQRKPMKSR